MSPHRLALGIAGLGLLALAAALVPRPRPNPRPDLPEIPPFAPGERIALVLAEPRPGPAAETLGLVQRARAAGADLRIFRANEAWTDFAPARVFQPASWPETPPGYHPDQWPAYPAQAEKNFPAQMLVLTAPERKTRNTAVLAAARRLQAAETDDIQGSMEAAVLAESRRSEIYILLKYNVMQ